MTKERNMLSFAKKIIRCCRNKINYCESCERTANRQLAHKKLLDEILMSQIFHDSMIDISWLKSKNFSPREAAANYSFLYVLLRVLNEFRPTNILELGIGQTTKLTTQYVTHGESQSQLFVVEHDEAWASFFEKGLPLNDRIHLLKLMMVASEFKNHSVNVYKDLIKNVADQRFDFLIIDGPLGSDRYSRIGILDVVKKYLQQRFVILIDDVDRLGEQEPAEEIKKELDLLNVSYVTNLFKGTKSQLLISSCALFY